MFKINQKINIVAKYFYPVAGGMEVNMLETYSNFVKWGWKICVYTSKNSLTEENVFKREERFRGVNIKRISMNIINFLPWKMGVNLNENTFVCLHGSDTLPGYYFYILTIIKKITRRKKYKLIWTPHGIFYLNIGETSTVKIRIKTIIDQIVGVFLINHAVDSIRAVSNWERNLLINHGIKPELIYVIRNGLEPEAFTPTETKVSTKIKSFINNLGDYIIQVGRIQKIKNQETAISALSLLPNNIKLLLVGPNHSLEYRTKLEKMITDLRLENRVVFAGVIRGVDKYYLIRHARCMVHLSKLEGFCNAVHEGMSQGIPCVVSSGSALEELIEDGKNGFVVRPNDYRKTAEKIHFILNPKNQKIVNKFKYLNVKITRENSWENTAKKVDKLYLSLQ